VLFCLLSAGCSLFVPMEKPAGSSKNLILWMPGASSVQVLSDWNEWGSIVSAGGILNPLEGRMEMDEDGFWKLDISHLRGGVYRYIYFVNGHKWIRDPVNPETASFEGRVVSIIFIED